MLHKDEEDFRNQAQNKHKTIFHTNHAFFKHMGERH